MCEKGTDKEWHEKQGKIINTIKKKKRATKDDNDIKPSFSSWLLFMKEIQIVCCCNCQNIVPRVPLCMQDLPVEVQTVHAHLILALPARGGDALVAQHPAQSAHVSGRLVAVVCLCLPVKDPEEIVVGACDYFTGKQLWVKDG